LGNKKGEGELLRKESSRRQERGEGKGKMKRKKREANEGEDRMGVLE
jgi:hypothetical protein